MSERKIDHIIIISFMCVAIVARMYVVNVLGWDEFSGFIAFVVSILIFGALYFAF